MPYPVATVASNLYPRLADGIGGVDDAVASAHQRDTERVDGAHRCDRRAPGQMGGMRGGPTREGVGDLDVSVSRGVHQVVGFQSVQRVVEFDAQRSGCHA